MGPKYQLRVGVLLLAGVVGFVIVGCSQQQPSAPPPPSAASPNRDANAKSAPASTSKPGEGSSARSAAQGPPAAKGTAEPAPALPPGHPPIQPSGESKAPVAPPAAPATPAAISPDGLLALSGLTMKCPPAWKNQPISAAPMAPVAVLSIVDSVGAPQAEVRITHFPSMKGMPAEPNIDRWLSQVVGPDGKPVTRDQAKVETTEHGGVTITLLDVCGKLTAAPGMGGGVIENGRLIAAIVEHPEGPHFVKITGRKDAMDACAAAALEFIQSAAVAP